MTDINLTALLRDSRARQAAVKARAHAALARLGGEVVDEYDGTPASEQRIVQRYERDTHAIRSILAIWKRWPNKAGGQVTLPSGKILRAHQILRDGPRVVGAEKRPRRNPQ